MLRKEDFESDLERLIWHANDQTPWRAIEFDAYPVSKYILSLYSRTKRCSFATFTCHPQPAFRASDGSVQLPDFAPMITFGPPQDSIRPKTQAECWWEVKPFVVDFNKEKGWRSSDINRGAQEEFPKYIEQLNTQASAAFGHLKGDELYAWLILGMFFSVFKYRRHEVERAFSSTTSAHAPVTTNPEVPRRAKRKRQESLIGGLSSSWTKCRPTVICYMEDMFTPSYQLTTALKVALSRWVLPADAGFVSQPSFFDPPPDADEFTFDSGLIVRFSFLFI